MLMPAPSTGAVAIFEALLEARTGQRLGTGRQWRIATELTPLCQDVGTTSLDDLARLMVADASGRLADRTVDALLNNETSFFRDPPAFDLVRERLEAGTKDRPVRIWSAGCSTGQEPLSLAMLAAEVGANVEITATDVSPGAITRARTGRFSQFEIQRGLSVHRMVRWFGQDRGDWIARADLLATIQYQVASVLTAPPSPGFNLVLCRNVLFYLAPAARRYAIGQLRASLRPGGLVLLGAGETLLLDGDGLAPSDRYRGGYEVVPDADRPPDLAARGRAA